MPEILKLTRVWDRAQHNGLPDLIHYRGKFFCTLRESDAHAGGEDGQIRILSSETGEKWTSVVLLSVAGIDLRDPMLSEMPDGRLMLTMGGSIYDKEEYKGRNPCVAFSDNGGDWSPVNVLNMPDEWIWRITWHKGIGYGGSYRADPADKTIPWVLTLFKTVDGLHYEPITQLDVPNNPSEATLRFTPDDTMVALVRRMGFGWIGHSQPPYKKWKWHETTYRLGGPNFLILPNGKMLAGSRLHSKKEPHFQTALFHMSLDSYGPSLVLPSDGDTSYPGMAYKDGLLFMCYYSSHEEKTITYFATIDLGKAS